MDDFNGETHTPRFQCNTKQEWVSTAAVSSEGDLPERRIRSLDPLEEDPAAPDGKQVSVELRR